MTGQLVQFPKLPHPIDGAFCQVTGCQGVIDWPAVMCSEHYAMVPRPILCRIRQAWRANDTNRWGRWAVEAVQAVEDRLDAAALAGGDQ